MKILSKVTALLFFAVFMVNAQEYQEQHKEQYQGSSSSGTTNIFVEQHQAQHQEQYQEPLVLQNAQNTSSPQHPNTRTSIYLHPVSLLVGLEAKAPLVYVTVEKPFSLYNALIVKPSLWNLGDLLRVGSDVGLRHYLTGKGEGQYLQIQGGAFYLSSDFIFDTSIDWNKEAEKKRDKKSTAWYDFLGYYGHSYKYAYVSIYSDVGIGYGCIAGKCALIGDYNFGIGISF